MRYLLLVAVVVGLCPGWVSADSGPSEKATPQLEGNVDYWSKIYELSKKGTPQGNPELVSHLKTLNFNSGDTNRKADGLDIDSFNSLQ